ncbi:hypothetical protein AB205_0045890 [Aquarana catesbeiana]|uniref:Uncharacterized protein n=1 Tax=Aquarana catesbeiana TaxID=8400 RepID=A0A2G9R3A6_AQUCT|nr:hypothetical protein AB205_0045890 [Aquarana catesbeiana]
MSATGAGYEDGCRDFNLSIRVSEYTRQSILKARIHNQKIGRSLLSSEMLAVLMLYLWFGVGIACAAFCSHQLLLISRGPACHQSPGAEASPIRWADNLTSVFGKRWMLAVLVPHVKEK